MAIDLYIHNNKLESKFFTRVIITYILLLIIGGGLLATYSYIKDIDITYNNNVLIDELVDNSDHGNLLSAEVVIKQNDTIGSILQAQNLPNSEKTEIINLIKKAKLGEILQIGRKIIFDYEINITTINAEDDLAEESQILRQITYSINNTRRLEIFRNDTGTFVIRDQNIPLKKTLAKYSTLINNSVLESAKSLKVSTGNIIELINIYGHQIDFQRQVKPGDQLTIVAEKFYTDKGIFSHHGKILFASLVLSGKAHNIYRYSSSNNDKYQFFSENAQSVTSNLLRTPLKVLRITSHFGRRTHPILGYTKMHTGVDFAAPKGTPIYAAGDGIITEIGWKGGYGNYIKIRHNNSISTAYAHASKFAANLTKGYQIKQGQVIAYVGTTGRSTNPHLHYEVLVNNQHINPLNMKIIPKTKLNGSRLADFEKHKKYIKDICNNTSDVTAMVTKTTK